MFVLQTGPAYRARKEYQEEETALRRTTPNKRNQNLQQPIVRQTASKKSEVKKGENQLLSSQKMEAVKTVSAYVWDAENYYATKIYSDSAKGTSVSAKVNVNYDSNSLYREIVARINGPLAWTFTPANGKRLDQLDYRNRDLVRCGEDDFVVLQNSMGNTSGKLVLGFENNYVAGASVGQAVDGGEFSVSLVRAFSSGNATMAEVQIRDKNGVTQGEPVQIAVGSMAESGYIDPTSGQPIQIHIRSAKAAYDSSLQTADIGLYSEVYTLEQGKRFNNVASDAPGADRHYVVSLGGADGGYLRTGTSISLIADDPSGFNGETRLREGDSIPAPSLLREGKLYNEGLSRRTAVGWKVESANATLTLADEAMPFTPNGQKATGTFMRLLADSPIFGLIIGGNSSGKISDLYLDLDQGQLYYKADSGYYIKKAMPEGLSMGNMKVSAGNVSGDGGVIYIDTLNKRLGITANARPEVTQANFVYTYLPYNKGIYDYQFGAPQYKALGQTEFTEFESPLWTQRTDRITLANSTRVDLEFSQDITTSTNQLTLQSQKRVKQIHTDVVEEGATPSKASKLSFGMYEQAHFPIAIKDPDRAQVQIVDLRGVPLNVYAQKEEDGFTLFSGALTPGTYAYTLVDGKRVQKGVFNIRP